MTNQPDERDAKPKDMRKRAVNEPERRRNALSDDWTGSRTGSRDGLTRARKGLAGDWRKLGEKLVDNWDRLKRWLSDSDNQGIALRALGTLLLLVAGLTVLWWTRSKIGVTGDVVLTVALVLPAIAYAILSRLINEVTVGGISLKFNEASRAPVQPTGELVNSSEWQQVEKGPITILSNALASMDSSRTIVMSISVGGQRDYTTEDLLVYLEELGSFANFEMVVFLDRTERLLAYTQPGILDRLLGGLSSRRGNGQPLMEDQVNPRRMFGERQTFLNWIDDYPPYFSTESLPSQISNRDALDRMVRMQVRILPLVDELTDRFVGVVVRDDLVAKLVLAASADKTG